MPRLLTILSLIFAVLLFPPAVLALISNNSVPGDAAYPIKRGLEDVIFTFASITPVTKAWFAAARSDRRFKEFSTLLAEGRSASNTLNELVDQTEIAAKEVENIEDKTKKQEFINQLTESIDKYDQKLEEVSHSGPPPAVEVSKTPVVTPTVTSPRPQASTIPTSTPEPSGVSKPSETPKPSVTSAPTQPPSTTQAPINRQETEDARRKLEEIRRRLKHEQQQEIRNEQNQDNRREEKQEDHQKKEDSNLTPLKEEHSGSKVKNNK